MKKFYLLALSLLSVAAASAQTLTLYHNDNAIEDGATVTVTSPKVTGDETHGYIYMFEAGVAIKGDKTDNVTWTATKEGDFVGCGDVDSNPQNFAYQICPEGLTCNDDLNTKTSATSSFKYRTSYDIFDLGIHYTSGENASADNIPVVYAKVKYEVAYDANPGSKLTFTVVFDNDPAHAAVSNITVDNSNAPVEYFNLNGTRVNADNLTPGLYIRRQGTTATKHLVK